VHEPHPTNAPPALQPASASAATPTYDVVHALLADGRSASVLTYRPEDETRLQLPCAALSAAVGDDAHVVVLRPAGDPLPPLLRAALRCSAERPVLASRGPVTDALKRVADGVVVADVDRTRLAWVVGPAVIDAAALRSHLAAVTSTTTRPLVDIAPRVDWL
jgi:hypothetical protein